MNDLTSKYRTVLFENQIGRDVLADILSMCHFGCTLDPENSVQISEYNVGMAILNKCGVFSRGTEEEVLRALAGVIPIEE